MVIGIKTYFYSEFQSKKKRTNNDIKYPQTIL